MRNGMNPDFGFLKGNHQLDVFSGSFHFSFPAANQQVFRGDSSSGIVDSWNSWLVHPGDETFLMGAEVLNGASRAVL